MTVFIVPPRNVPLKVGDQLLERGEGVVAFLAAEVPMIAFACFVVEPQNALAVYEEQRKSHMTPLVAEWANTIRVEEAPTTSAPKS